MRAFKWLLLLGLALFCLGCEGYKYVGGTNNPKPVRTQASLSPNATEVVLMYSAARTLGRTASDNFPGSIKTVPIIMTGIKPDFEQLSEVRPEGVVYDPHVISQADLEKIKQMNIQLLPIGGDSLQEFIDSLWKYAGATGSEMMINEYVNQIYKAVGDAKTEANGLHKG